MRRGVEEVAVLGAGIQGVSAALALAFAGHRVTLIDGDDDCMRGASLRSEGKIHLGLVYAHDPSFRTAQLMLESAFEFAPLLETWTGIRISWDRLVSRPFSYVVARDSMVAPDRLFAFYARVEDAYREIRGRPGLHYLGGIPERLLDDPLPAERAPWLNPEVASHLVGTRELAVDTIRLREVLREGLGRKETIRTLYSHRVCSVRRTEAGFRVSGLTREGTSWTQEAGVVVNCLWPGRLALDQQMDLLPKRPWVYRLKIRFFCELPVMMAGLPALTVVVGPYGDVVPWDDRQTYLSWYPACLRGWSSAVETPPEWERACRGEVAPDEASRVERESLDALSRIVPGLESARITDVAAGVIFAWGDRDIDDPASELHQRHDTGVRGANGYFTIDTGKLTSAPRFARQLLERIDAA
jgi:glycine/D-amino acid oxidase-like deaminating enzyme